MALQSRVYIEGGIFVAGCLFPLWKGGWGERLVAGVMLATFLLTLVAGLFEKLENPHYVSLALDVVVLLAVLYVAFRSNHRWALLGSALQLLSVLAHVTRVIDPSIGSWAYVTVSIALGYGLMLSVVYGTVQHMRAPS